MLNFAEQLYDILVGEIELGRWKINERLPGVIQLAKELGFGTKTIQTAYDRLKQEGYVNTLGYRGTYLKSQHPQANDVAGKIGVLVSEDQTGQPLILWYEHVILLQARRKNLLIEVKVLPASMDIRKADERGLLFGDDVSGIISLTPFILPIRYGDANNTLPIVFLCPPFERCVPKVCADVREAYYDLTSRVIRNGYKRVLFSEDRVESDPRQTQMHLQGYMEAMKEHRLPVDTALLKASAGVNNDDLQTVVDHLKAIMKLDRSEGDTAIVGGSLGRSMALTRVAPLLKIEIPQDLSIVSIGSALIKGETGRQITGMLPDFDRMVEMCFTLLEQQKLTGKSEFTKIHFRMHFLPGDTLRSLSGEDNLNAGTTLESTRFRDIHTLSRAVGC